MQWTDRIGRRIKLHDLHVLLAVAQAGTMAKAAKQLAVSHPVISKTISDLERSLGVRLFDRTSRGTEPTQFGRALLDCGTAVFDDLRRGIKEIEFLSDPATSGELRVGAAEPVMIGLVFAAMQSLRRRYPRIEFHTTMGDTPALYRALRDRKVDLVVSRKFQWTAEDEEEIEYEPLFQDCLYVVAGLQSRWSRRRKIALAELLGEPWVLPRYDNVVGALIADGFRSIGVAPLKAQVVSDSMIVRTDLVAENGFLTMLIGSMLHFCGRRLALKALPVALPMKPQTTAILTLKSRTPSSATKLFRDCLRETVKPLAKAR